MSTYDELEGQGDALSPGDIAALREQLAAELDANGWGEEPEPVPSVQGGQVHQGTGQAAAPEAKGGPFQGFGPAPLPVVKMTVKSVPAKNEQGQDLTFSEKFQAMLREAK